MAICQAFTRKGKGPKCVIGDATFHAESQRWLCHLHHPDALFRQQVTARHEERKAACGNRLPNSASFHITARSEVDAEALPPDGSTPGMNRKLEWLTAGAGLEPSFRLPRKTDP